MVQVEKFLLPTATAVQYASTKMQKEAPVTWSWMLLNRSLVTLAAKEQRGPAAISRRCSFRAMFADSSSPGRFLASTLRAHESRRSVETRRASIPPLRWQEAASRRRVDHSGSLMGLGFSDLRPAGGTSGKKQCHSTPEVQLKLQNASTIRSPKLVRDCPVLLPLFWKFEIF
jgi:hypothetical protein